MKTLQTYTLHDLSVYNQFIIDMLDALYVGVQPKARPTLEHSFEDVLAEMDYRLTTDYPEVLLEYFHATFDPLMTGE